LRNAGPLIAMGTKHYFGKANCVSVMKPPLDLECGVGG